MRNFKFLPTLLLIALFLSSCLQHKIQITVNEDGSVDYTYTISGDSVDLYDGLTALPKGLPWDIQQYSQKDTAANSQDTVYYYIAKAHFAPGEKLPSGFGLEHLDFASTSLELPLTVKKQSLFFLDKYTFELQFPGRKFLELYGNPQDYIPAECSKLEETDSLAAPERARLEKLQSDGYKAWAAASLASRFFKSLDQSRKMHPEVKLDTVKIDTAKSALTNYIANYIRNINIDQPVKESDIWQAVFEPGYRILEEQLNFLGDTTFFLDMRTAGEILSREYDVTNDLSDEAFSIELKLPGNLKTSNADTVLEYLRWEFNGDEISDSTKTLTAISTIYYYERMYISAGGLIIVIVIIFFVVRRKSKRAPETTA